MKYTVATVVSVLLGALLICGESIRTLHTEGSQAALAASLSALKIRQLATLYWECQDQSADNPYQRDPGECAVIGRAMQRRVNEMPAP